MAKVSMWVSILPYASTEAAYDIICQHKLVDARTCCTVQASAADAIICDTEKYSACAALIMRQLFAEA